MPLILMRHPRIRDIQVTAAPQLHSATSVAGEDPIVSPGTVHLTPFGRWLILRNRQIQMSSVAYKTTSARQADHFESARQESCGLKIRVSVVRFRPWPPFQISTLGRIRLVSIPLNSPQVPIWCPLRQSTNRFCFMLNVCFSRKRTFNLLENSCFQGPLTATSGSTCSQDL